MAMQLSKIQNLRSAMLRNQSVSFSTVSKPDALEAAGVSASDGRRPDAPVSLVRLAVAPDGYWLAFDNFYVITRNNHSNLYAMVVFQLSKEIRRLYDEPGRQAVAGN
jgi:membrane-bound lytic murein transglycosylase B